MRRVGVLVLLFAATACSDRSIVAPESYGRRPCRPSADLVAMVDLVPFTPEAMRSALRHGADEMTRAVSVEPRQRDVQDAMRLAADDIGIGHYDSACRFVGIAFGALRALPDSAGSYPDRDGIRLILALTAHALSAEMQR